MTNAIDPGHYKGFSNGAQVIDISENLTSNAGQAVQYIARSCRLDGANKGDQIEDLTKAAWFIARELERLQAALTDPGSWEVFEDVPVGELFRPVSMPGLVLEKLPENLYQVVDRPCQYRTTAIVITNLAPFVRADS
jgi:hypothetical protein